MEKSLSKKELMDKDVTLVRNVLAKNDLLPDWLIVDHLDFDYKWESAIRPLVKKIMVVDDFGKQEHDCEVYLNQVWNTDAQELKPPSELTRINLLGPQYILLDPSYQELRSRLDFPKKYDPHNKLVHLLFGTSDPKWYTLEYTKVLLEAFPSIKLRISLGAHSGQVCKLQSLASNYKSRVEVSIEQVSLANDMWGCGLGIGTPGMSTWERSCLGLPTAYLINSDNQVPVMEKLLKNGLCDVIGNAESLKHSVFIRRVEKFFLNKERLNKMRDIGLRLIDGSGAKRVADAIISGGD